MKTIRVVAARSMPPLFSGLLFTLLVRMVYRLQLFVETGTI